MVRSPYLDVDIVSDTEGTQAEKPPLSSDAGRLLLGAHYQGGCVCAFKPKGDLGWDLGPQLCFLKQPRVKNGTQ